MELYSHQLPLTPPYNLYEATDIADESSDDLIDESTHIVRFTNTKLRDGVTELSLPKIQTDMLKDYDR